MTDRQSEQFSQIYDQYIEKIYRFVYLKVSSEEVAEDVTSKVFINGWEAFQKASQDSINEIKNPGAFLYQIARNAVIDYYREKGRSKVVSADASPEIVDPGTSSHDKAILNADVDTVRKAISKIKKEYQDVIIWYYLEDMPVASISELTGKSAGAIRVLLHRGLAHLKDIIEKQ